MKKYIKLEKSLYNYYNLLLFITIIIFTYVKKLAKIIFIFIFYISI